jgi:hypothetical protein
MHHYFSSRQKAINPCHRFVDKKTVEWYNESTYS